MPAIKSWTVFDAKRAETRPFGSSACPEATPALSAQARSWAQCKGYAADFFRFRPCVARRLPMEGIAWQWQSIDGAMGKAPMGQPKKATRGSTATAKSW
jgi:hypothetical protein